MIIQLKLDRLKLIKFFILKLIYLFLLSFRSYFLKDNTKLFKSKLNMGLYRANSQLSIFNLMNKDEYNLIKIPVIKEIFKIRDGDFQLITDSMFTKNYIIFAEKTEKLKFNQSSTDYKKYRAKAKLSLANEIYSTFDKAINEKYNVEINQKVLKRIKNTY